jgi:hypothetical protein
MAKNYVINFVSGSHKDYIYLKILLSLFLLIYRLHKELCLHGGV